MVPGWAILIADDENAPAAVAYVMPTLVGLTLAAAQSRLSGAGLHIALPEPAENPEVQETGAGEAAVAPDPAIPPTITPAYGPNSIISSQSPLPGRRVSRADNIHVVLSN